MNLIPPRPVPWRWVRKWLFESHLAAVGAASLAFSAPALVALLGLFVWFQPRMVDDDLIRARGEAVPGSIVRVTVNEWTTVGSRKDARHPITVVYRYQAEGADRSDEMETLDPSAANWPAGRTVTVRHYQGESHIAGLARYSFPWVWLIAVIGLQVPFSLLFMVPGYLGMRTRWRCHRDGVLAKAKLTGMEAIEGRYGMVRMMGFPVGGNPGPIHRYRVSYVFHGPAGEKILGQAPTADLLFFNTKQPGDVIDILVLPGKERVNCLPEPGLLAWLP